jgi:hypothetical protein
MKYNIYIPFDTEGGLFYRPAGTNNAGRGIFKGEQWHTARNEELKRIRRAAGWQLLRLVLVLDKSDDAFYLL